MKSMKMLIPAMLMLIFLFLFPLLKTVWISIDLPHLSLRAYARLFTQDVFLISLRTTGILSATVTLIALVFGYPLALLLYITPGKLQKLLILLVITQLCLSFLVRTYSWLLLLQDAGIANYILMHLV